MKATLRHIANDNDIREANLLVDKANAEFLVAVNTQAIYQANAEIYQASIEKNENWLEDATKQS